MTANNQRALWAGGWKYVESVNGLDGPGLYNLIEDPGEQRNLAEKESKRLANLKTIFAAWKEDVAHNATEQPNRPPEIR